MLDRLMAQVDEEGLELLSRVMIRETGQGWA
jgi:hypothetical protein